MQLVEITRSSKGHQLNHRSSRSHCVVTLKCSNKKGNSLKQSRFLFVDLAGSERIHKSGATNIKAEEAKSINQSLTTLGRCILAIKSKNGGHPPYRETSLTMLLKDSLSGNCKTCMICTIADEPSMVAESVSSLRFGLNCGHVKLKATQQQSTNIQDQVGHLEKSLYDIENELNSMRQKGMHGYFDESQPKPTRDQFVDNYKKLESAQAQLYKSANSPAVKEQL